MLISGIYAFTNLSVLNITNEVNTGAVKISLNEYTVNNGNESLYEENEGIVFPGQIISLIPRISNIGDSSYIRAKIGYLSDSEAIELSDSNIEGMTGDWIKKGDYWYYKNVVNSGENIDIFKSFKIPVNISNEYQGRTIDLNITAEAIQSENFTPNFDSENPWNGINAESAKDYQMDKIQKNTNAVIEYTNNANLYVTVSDSFFSKLGHIVPGDSLSEEVSINNKSNGNAEYFVSTEVLEGASEKELDLMKKLNLRITSENGVIYEGSLDGLNQQELGKFKSNETAKILFTVTMPSELGNEYSLLSSSIKWKFDIKYDDVVPKKDEPKIVPVKPDVKSPQTGDTKIKIAIAIFIIASISLIVVLFLEKKSKNKEK